MEHDHPIEKTAKAVYTVVVWGEDDLNLIGIVERIPQTVGYVHFLDCFKHLFFTTIKNKKLPLGIEPRTFSLQERCSTSELKERKWSLRELNPRPSRAFV